MSMPIRRTTKKETEQPQYASAARHEPERHPTSPSSLLAEDLTFLAAWRNGLVPCPGAFLRQLPHANARFIAVLHGGAVMEKAAPPYFPISPRWGGSRTAEDHANINA
jgi:hypothetical protein